MRAKAVFQLFVQIHLPEHAEQTEARGVDKNGDRRLLPLQKLTVDRKALALLQVQDDGPHLRPTAFLQGFQAFLPPRDDPELVKILLAVQRIDEFASHAGGRAGDDSDLHRLIC